MNQPDDLAQQRTELTTTLLDAQEQMAPIYDAADGMRAELQSRGWSPASAEQAALTWLCGAINMTWQPQG